MKLALHSPILGLVFGLGFAWSALAQQPVVTSPSSVGTVNTSGTIGTGGGTFQSVFAAAGHVAKPSVAARQGCLVQNTGGNVEYVFVGPIASATEATSYQLVPPGTGIQGGSISCATLGGGVLQDQISITGTSGDTFTATRQ
jgi:hypothetical protein